MILRFYVEEYTHLSLHKIEKPHSNTQNILPMVNDKRVGSNGFSQIFNRP